MSNEKINVTKESPVETPSKFFIRDWKGMKLFDAGPYLETGQKILNIENHEGAVEHTMYFNATDPADLNKVIENAKEWINANVKEDSQERPKYSDGDLAIFKEILDKKLAAAIKELEYLQSKVKKSEDPDRQPGEEVLSDEDLAQFAGMASRQQTFIDNLNAALSRIENKTYGICRVTGKLIDKARLRAVPHATLSIEAKASMKNVTVVPDPVKKSRKKPTIKSIDLPKNEEERKCRVCGCTEDNCSHCIEKTGVACNWVEPDLCSACVPVAEVPYEAADAADCKEVKEEPTLHKQIPTNFFKALISLIPKGLDVTLRIHQKGDIITAGLFPAITSKQKPVNMIGTAAELDQDFFTRIIPDAKDIPGLVTNIDQVKKEAAAAPAEKNQTVTSKRKQQRKSPAKPMVKKKEAPKPPQKKSPSKPAAKKPAAPKPKPAAKEKVKPTKSDVTEAPQTPPERSLFD